MELNEIIKRMHNQELYFCNDETLVDQQLKCLDKLYDFN